MSIINSFSISTKELILVALFAALTAIGAFIKIPTPFGVPFTLQPLFVMFAASLLGAKLALISQLVYILTGLAGFPIFTKGGGFHYIFQPTFGYLIGFAAGAYVIGKIIENREKKISNFLGANFAGLIVFYTLGASYLYLIMNFYIGQDYPINKALIGGFLVFLPWDALKAVITSIIAPKVINRIKEISPIVQQ
ncbi:MAG: biotin transporter BioY [Halanaerobacter sp.]